MLVIKPGVYEAQKQSCSTQTNSLEQGPGQQSVTVVHKTRNGALFLSIRITGTMGDMDISPDQELAFTNLH